MTQFTISMCGQRPRLEASKPMEFLLLILAILVGNAVQDPKIISIGLPVAAACLVFSMVWAALLKKRLSTEK